MVPVNFDRGHLAVRLPGFVTGVYRRQFGVLFAPGLVTVVLLSGVGLVVLVGFCRS